MSKMNMGNLLKQAQKVQAEIQKIQERLGDMQVEGTAGGGMVSAIANGKNEIIRVKIEPEVIDPDDVEILEDLIVAAVNQALTKSQELASSEMSKAAGGMLGNLPPGFSMPGL